MQMSMARLMRHLGRDRFRRDDFAITHLPLGVAGLDSAFYGYRIVHITDIHYGHWVTQERLEGIVALINEQKPDLVVNTGDFISYVLDEVAPEMVQALQKIDAPDGSLAVMGNHDHWMGANRVRPVLREAGLTLLDNDVYPVRRGEAVLYVAGVDNVTVGADDLTAVLTKLPNDGPALILAHEPDFADEAAATQRFFLQLSGHSHGSQIILPRIGPLLRGHHFKKYPAGRYQVGDMALYTSHGVGTHTFRLRINCPPEIVVVTLHPA